MYNVAWLPSALLMWTEVWKNISDLLLVLQSQFTYPKSSKVLREGLTYNQWFGHSKHQNWCCSSEGRTVWKPSCSEKTDGKE